MDTEAQPTPWGLEPLIDVGELATYLGYRTFGVSFGAVFCCVGAVVRVLKLGWPGFMGGQKVCLGSGFFVVVPRDKSV